MYATYEVQKTQILMDYISSTGEWMGGESIQLRPTFKGDPQQVAYNYASVRAHIHGVTLQALRAA